MTPRIERRQHNRVPMMAEVHCGTLEPDQLFVTRDISAGGVFLNTPFPLPHDSSVVLSFRLRPDDPIISCAGKVVYSEKGAGMGIQFFDVAGDLERTLSQFLEEAH